MGSVILVAGGFGLDRDCDTGMGRSDHLIPLANNSNNSNNHNVTGKQDTHLTNITFFPSHWTTPRQ
jgi:hypothetical protein